MSDKFDAVKYDKEYKKENYEQIIIRAKKEDQLKKRLDILAISTNKSKNQLILEAIETMLRKEGL